MSYLPSQNLYKWIGGKKWLSKTLQEQGIKYINPNKTIYVEPFLGGMGSFLALLPILKEKGINTFILNDINKVIIELLSEIKNNPNNIYLGYKKLMEELYSFYPKDVELLHPVKDKEEIKIQLNKANELFKECRKKFNHLILDSNNNNKKQEEDNLDKKSIYFLFLMKNSFNGIYRENLKGEFNTPFNWNNKKETKDVEQILKEYENLFNENNIIFENLDVFELLEKYKDKAKDIFLYLDPPYINENGGENSYSSDPFGQDKQIKLLETLSSNFDNYIYSNHSNEEIKAYFNETNNSYYEKNKLITEIDTSTIKQNTKRTYLEIDRKNIMSAKNESRKESKTEILGIVY
jgi:DNA adenine methylase